MTEAQIEALARKQVLASLYARDKTALWSAAALRLQNQWHHKDALKAAACARLQVDEAIAHALKE